MKLFCGLDTYEQVLQKRRLFALLMHRHTFLLKFAFHCSEIPSPRDFPMVEIETVTLSLGAAYELDLLMLCHAIADHLHPALLP